MDALVIHSAGDLRVEPFPTAEVGPGQALVLLDFE
jgi:L-idonate 5-dehydrogenase